MLERWGRRLTLYKLPVALYPINDVFARDRADIIQWLEWFNSKNVEVIVAQEYKVEFLGKNFDQIVNLLTEIKAEKIYAWLSDVIQKKIQPIVIGSKKHYKEWSVTSF